MAEYTIQGIQERRREADSINRMLARAQRDPRLRRFFTPSMLSEAMNELNTYTAGYNAQVKAQEDAIRAQQEAEKQQQQRKKSKNAHQRRYVGNMSDMMCGSTQYAAQGFQDVRNKVFSAQAPSLQSKIAVAAKNAARLL